MAAPVTAARRVIFCADDFGRDPAVNEAVEIAHRDGILSTASLMVGARYAADAVERARKLPGLRVGLHLVLIDGAAITPREQISSLVDADGRFDGNQGRAGFRYFFTPGIRRQLGDEIRAQFDAFRATGLPLDHVNAHKHMHLHPTVAQLVVETGRDYGMRAMRVPLEPRAPLQAAFPGEAVPRQAYAPVIAALRRRLRRSRIACNDQVFGIGWSGGMDERRLLALLPHLPGGVSDVYFHPAVRTTPELAAEMPGYRHADELAALCSATVRARVAELGIEMISYGELAPSG
ncbi:MAG: hopanoid biosynthesis-associated protein HpnK [Alphaproteobacteria bacterium]|nr:hopanoid biosynthesis-associated protein HpnK [Alphaproteobacteria bacterium]